MRRLSCGALLAMLASLCAVVTALPASAATVDNAGNWAFVTQGGFIDLAGNNATVGSPVSPPECNNGINDDEARDAPGTFQDNNIDFPADAQCASLTDDSETQAGQQDKLPMTVAAAVNSSGTLSGFGFNSEPLFVYSTQGIIEVQTIMPGGGNSGTINPATGALNINLSLEIKITAFAAVTVVCQTPAFTVNLSTTNAHPGNPITVTPQLYSSATGEATLVDNNFTIPATTNSVTPSLCNPVNTGFGLPAAAGSSAMQLTDKTFATTGTVSPTPVLNNNQPTANAGSTQTVPFGTTVNLTGSGTDPDASLFSGTATHPGPLYYQWTQTGGTTITSFNNSPTWNPGANVNVQNPSFVPPAPGDYTFQLAVADGANASRSSAADGHVTSGSTTVTSATAAFTANDVGALISGTGIPAGDTIASFTSSTSVVLATAATGTSTTAALGIQSGEVFSPNTSSVTIHVSNPPAPVANTDTYSTPFNTPLTVSAPGVLANDTGASITVTNNTAPSHGNVTINSDGSFTYTPTSNYTGPDSFTYTVTDIASQTAVGTVNLTVNAPTAPVATDDSYSSPDNTTLNVSAPGVLGNDTGTSISVTSSTQPTNGSVTVNSDGSFSYTPNANFQGSDSFTYTITDAAAQTATATVDLTITDTAPVANAGTPQSVLSGTTGVTLDGSASSDPDSGPSPLTYAWTQTGGPTVSLTGANTASPSFNAPVIYCAAQTLTFQLTVNDGALSNSATVTVNVTKPVITRKTAGDFNGDGTADPVLYNQSTATWMLRCQGTFVFGSPGDIAVPGDYNGDGITDVATYTPKTSPGGNGTWVGNEGLWKIRGQKAFEFAGLQGDIPVPADYFGDGMTHAALFRPSTGQWFIRPQGAPQFGNPNPIVVTFGQAGDIPVPGDYNGDGVADLAFYRPSTGQWFIGNGLNVSSPSIVKPNFPLNLTPMVADYNGDGKTDIMGVDSTTGKWYLNGHGNIAVATGQAGDVPMAADYNGDGIAEIGRYRPGAGVVIIDGEAPFFFGGSGFAPANTNFVHYS